MKTFTTLNKTIQKTVLILVLFIANKPTSPATTYSGNQLWKIENTNVTNQILNQLLKNNHIAIWGRDPNTTHVMIDSSYAKNAHRILTKNSINYEIALEDIQELIDAQKEDASQRVFHPTETGHNLTWRYYHRLADIYKYLDFLADKYPHLCTVASIGKTGENRAIKMLKISNKNAENAAVYVEGGIHAREWISPATATFLINSILRNPSQKWLQTIDWYIIPVLNPDGYEYSHEFDRLWRKNRRFYNGCHGIDLNRNFGYKWNANTVGASRNPCESTYRGPAPFSELETLAVKRFFRRHIDTKWRGFVALHSYGQFMLYPWSSVRKKIVDWEKLEGIGRKTAQEIFAMSGVEYKTGSVADVVYQATGSSMDWARGEIGIKYVYTIELRDRGIFGFLLPSSLINEAANDALIGVKNIAKAILNDEQNNK